MVKITKINVEVKKSWNYQTYTYGVEAELEEGETADNIADALFNKCKTKVVEKISQERKEVGLKK